MIDLVLGSVDVEKIPENEKSGDAELESADALEIEVTPGLKFTRMHAHKIGRVVLAKAFVGDLLAEWKRVVVAHSRDFIEGSKTAVWARPTIDLDKVRSRIISM